MRPILRILLTCLLCAATLEICLRYIDPTGMYAYRADMHAHINSFVTSERGYTAARGVYSFHGWRATIGADGNRVLPDAHDGACHLAFVGDSLTFGFGVDDADTFANLLAAQLDARVSNTALSGYNSSNVINTLATWQADGYVYVIVNNDDEINRIGVSTQPRHSEYALSALETYWRALSYQPTPHYQRAAFERHIRYLAGRGDVLLVTLAWANWYRGVVEIAPDVVVLPMYADTVSLADKHPNAAAHQGIAAGLMPHVVALRDKVC